MTHIHDEEVRELRNTISELQGYIAQAESNLRIVVKLHPTFMNSKDEVVCCHCFVAYPCPTIQAIEKELAVG